MKNLKSHLTFNKQERSGIFFLLLFIILLQIGYFLWVNFSTKASLNGLQVNIENQSQIDLLKEKALQKDSIKIYPFNPNFITDYKGYLLGMSNDEINRLHQFRQANSYVSSVQEFQQITQVSDSLLEEIAPFFKFPEWVENRSKSLSQVKVPSKAKKSASLSINENEKSFLDLNSATVIELKSINGIGDKLSVRIVKFRDRLGGFVTDEQFSHVYGIEPEVSKRVFKKFQIKTIPNINKININTASFKELTSLVYFNYDLAGEIVKYRDTNGRIATFDELATIEGFPTEKLNIIRLYLSLN